MLDFLILVVIDVFIAAVLLVIPLVLVLAPIQAAAG